MTNSIIEAVKYNKDTFILGASFHGREPSNAEVLAAALRAIAQLADEGEISPEKSGAFVMNMTENLVNIMTTMDHDAKENMGDSTLG